MRSEVTAKAPINHNKCSPQNTERKAVSSFLSHMQATTVPPFMVACENIHTLCLVFVNRGVYVVRFCPVQPSTLTGFQPKRVPGRSAIV